MLCKLSPHDPNGYHDPLHSNVRIQMQLHLHQSLSSLLQAALHILYLMPVVYHGRQGNNEHILSRFPVSWRAQEFHKYE